MLRVDSFEKYFFKALGNLNSKLSYEDMKLFIFAIFIQRLEENNKRFSHFTNDE